MLPPAIPAFSAGIGDLFLRVCDHGYTSFYLVMEKWVYQGMFCLQGMHEKRFGIIPLAAFVQCILICQEFMNSTGLFFYKMEKWIDPEDHSYYFKKDNVQAMSLTDMKQLM